MAIPIEKWISVIEVELKKKRESLSKAEDRENPNEDYCAKLEEQIRILDELQAILEEY